MGRLNTEEHVHAIVKRTHLPFGTVSNVLAAIDTILGEKESEDEPRS